MPSPLSSLSALDHYQAPTSIDARSWSDLVSSRVSFVVEAGGKSYDIEVEYNHWTGLEQYVVDGVERCSVRNMWPWVHEQIVLNEQPRTVLVFRSYFFPLLPVRVMVNDTLRLRNLFPALLRNLLLTSFVSGLIMGCLVLWMNWQHWIGF